MSERKTDTTPAVTSVLEALDAAWEAGRTRLDDMTEHEYLWCPVVDVWTIEPHGDETVVTGRGHVDSDAAPFTTIAWRTWHIAVDCLDDYSDRLFDRTAASVAGPQWHLRTDKAMADLDAAWRNFRSGLTEQSDEWFMDELGPLWGPFATSSRLDLVLHALHELTHHFAEIATIRDLYRHMQDV